MIPTNTLSNRKMKQVAPDKRLGHDARESVQNNGRATLIVSWRASAGGTGVPEIQAVCAKADEGTLQEIRELTMALVIDPSFVPALSRRTNSYLNLARGYITTASPSNYRLFLAAPMQAPPKGISL
jgi:hypothetical protein